MNTQRMFDVSYEMTNAWEQWIIQLTPEGQKWFDKEVTDVDDMKAVEEWLVSNPDAWEFFDLRDRGGDMSDMRLEEVL